MEVFLLISFVILIVYLLNTYYFGYWTRHGFKQMDDPKFLFGNISDLFLFRKSFSNCFIDLYEKFKHNKYIGCYFTYKPILFVNDPEVVQDILVRNFNSFTDRPRFVDEDRDPISTHLFNIGGEKWRSLRFKLSPTFSSGKLKGMFPIMRDCGKSLQSFMVDNYSKGKSVFNFTDLFAKYTTHNIVSVIFSIDSDTFNDPNNVFRKISANFSKPSKKQHVIDIFSFLIPNVLHALSIFNFKSVTANVNDFVMNFVAKLVKHREETKFQGNDFLQLLIELKNKGYTPSKKQKEDDLKDSSIGINNINIMKKLTIDEIAAQVHVFFVGGFETSTATMSFCLFELCRRPELQRKIQEELDEIFGIDTNFDDVTYEMFSNLKYLECCIDETLRLYPPLAILFRTCTKDYKIPDTDLIIEKGTSVYIPAIAIQRDERIYENPLEFTPERFMDSPTGNGKSNGGIFYLPFGDGPRHCIGERMGKMQAKIGLACILWKFSVEYENKNDYGRIPEFQKTQFFLRPSKPFNFKITPRF